MDFSEKWGKDIDEAVELALKDLKLTRDEVTIEVLEEPSKGFFGLGSKLAKVRVEPKAAEKQEEEKAPAPAETVKTEQIKPVQAEQTENKDFTAFKPADEKKKREERAPREKKQQSRPRSSAPSKKNRVHVNERPADLAPVEEHEALTFLKKVTEEMGLALTFKAAANKESMYIDIEGSGVGSIIGKRGQTLDSLQYLTSLVVNKKKDQYLRVVLDAENYREKREKTLEQLAERLANKVVKTKRSVRLEPMNPYERMIIHATLQGDDRVKTRSEGEEPYRRVVIELN
jgi:spoIIIJ-associated protein